jgi:hypothetical protein
MFEFLGFLFITVISLVFFVLFIVIGIELISKMLP